MADYKTPDVYVEEISTLPPSVAEVSTAIPAFLGYTEKVMHNGKNLTKLPTRITSFLEFKSFFGDPYPSEFTAVVESDNISVALVDPDIGLHNLYYSMDHYFKNGGGDCYVVSLGTFQMKDKIAFEEGIAALETEDEPTLIVLSEALSLGSPDYYSLCTKALMQCNKLKDRFCILDVIYDSTKGIAENSTDFRDNIGTENLKYGAAYYPYLESTLNYMYNAANVKVTLPSYSWGGILITRSSIHSVTPKAVVKIAISDDIAEVPIGFDISSNTLTITITKTGKALKDVVDAWKLKTLASDGFELEVNSADLTKEVKAELLSDLVFIKNSSDGAIKEFAKDFNGINIKFSGSAYEKFSVKATEGDKTKDVKFTMEKNTLVIDNIQGRPAKDIIDAWKKANESKNAYFDLVLNDNGSSFVKELQSAEIKTDTTLSAMSTTQTALYNAIKQEISKKRVTLPPSPAVAGIYATVDRERGVWKAPANVSLNAVIRPVAKISADNQENLNIDTTGGKSINAIRGFLGKGTLVWGARTLAGNDNEWRYVPVRRLFNMIEESTKKASYFAVFEPNDATTWLKVKGMIESFLYRLWQQGALAGSAPKAAYYVNVGLGKTMSQQDILEGRMIVEIGVAAVRPAEFIILKFSHKLQEA